MRPPLDQRSGIAIRAQSILNQFWREDIPAAERALELEGWCDVLEDCTQAEIRRAWDLYQKTGPRSQKGTLIKPDAGALHRIVMASRPRQETKNPDPDAPDERKVASAWEKTQARLSRPDAVSGRGMSELRTLIFGFYLHGIDERLWAAFTAWRSGARDADVSDFLSRFGIDVFEEDRG